MERREFLAGGTLVVGVAGAGAEAEEKKLPTPEVDAAYMVIAGRFGRRFSPDQMRQIRDEIERNLGAARALRTYVLHNGDAPASPGSQIYSTWSDR